jgi:hypothetical protein
MRGVIRHELGTLLCRECQSLGTVECGPCRSDQLVDGAEPMVGVMRVRGRWIAGERLVGMLLRMCERAARPSQSRPGQIPVRAVSRWPYATFMRLLPPEGLHPRSFPLMHAAMHLSELPSRECLTELVCRRF